jgi:2-methylcitrate dehydratase PrpD
MIYGRYCDIGEQILTYIEKNGRINPNEPLVSVLGGGLASKEDAVLAHTVMSRCSDLDDGFLKAMGHPGSYLVPVCLAVAECYGRTGAQMITALVAGYDMHARIAEQINPNCYRERGYEARPFRANGSRRAVSKLAGSHVLQTRDAIALPPTHRRSVAVLQRRSKGNSCVAVGRADRNPPPSSWRWPASQAFGRL